MLIRLKLLNFYSCVWFCSPTAGLLCVAVEWQQGESGAEIMILHKDLHVVVENQTVLYEYARAHR